MIYSKHDHEIIKNSEVNFNRLVSDVNKAKKMFDRIIRDPIKFICINDAMDHDSKNQPEIERLYLDFHEKSYSQPSPFEYQNGEMNEYLNIEHYNLQKQQINAHSIGEVFNVRYNDVFVGNGEFLIVFLITTAPFMIFTMFVMLRLVLRRRTARTFNRRIHV